MYKIILASESPRRREILKNAGFQFEVIPANISEFPNKNLNVDERILDIARRKSLAVMQSLPQEKMHHHLIVAADTEVVMNNQTLGKPKDAKHAFEMLKMLSNQSHEVKTALVIQIPDQSNELFHIETTQIYFHELSDQQIWNYVQSGEPMDKAGAYGIQGSARQFIKIIDGSFDNVVGLPLQVFLDLLRKGNLDVERKI